MKSKFLLLLMMMLLSLSLWQCQDVSPTTGATPGGTVSQVQGKIFDNVTRFPISGSTVYIVSTLGTDSASSTSDGTYNFNIDLNRLAAVSGSLQVRKNGYHTKTVQFNVPAGDVVSTDIYLDRDTSTGIVRTVGTGTAHSIALIGVSSSQISVFGVGGTESSILIWEVRDSLGFPIDIDHQDTVTFGLIGVPVTGGAYVSPSSAITNVSGRVATTVNSGTVSGAIQFVATLRRNIDGVLVQSTPVLITVNAGLPDQIHFTVAPAQFNFAGYDWEGRENPITVQVGDRFSNPVKVGTAVYFSTTGGVIVASGFTDAGSHSTVTLYSGNPRPNDPVFGAGFARVHAYTLGQNGVSVEDSVLVLFSGVPIISNVSPNSFAVAARGTSPPITFTVADENGNPLAPGTVITAALQYTPPSGSSVNLVTTGDVQTTLPDTQVRGPGITQFTIRVADQTEGGVGSQIPASVIITVTGPNGSVHYTIFGTIG